MKLSKAMAEALCELFGPNPTKFATVSTDTLRFRAFQELERHGLVKITKPESATYDCLRNVSRTMDKQTLCEVFTTNP